jgi:hypothetical protein
VPATLQISKDRYIELRAFCRQYPQWLVEAASVLGVSGARLDDMPHGTDPGDPTGRAVERREKVLEKINLVEGCAAAVENGRWFRALLLNVCNGMAWEYIRDLHPETLKSNDRNLFFKARRMFFGLLDQEKG